MAAMAVATIFVIFFVMLQLIYRYARILILTVMAPLVLLFGALPGQEGAISGWFKDLAVNTLVFPGVLLLFFISFTILTSSVMVPPTALGEIPGIGTAISGASASLGGACMALIVLLMSFKIPGIIENAIKGKR